MKNVIHFLAMLFVMMLIATGCSKKEMLQEIKKSEEVTQTVSNFGQHEFRDVVYDNPQKTAKGIKDAQLRRENTSSIGSPARVIFFKNGETVTDPNWNGGVTFTVAPYGNIDTLEQAIQRAKTHFAIFNVLVTTDEAVYLSFDIWHRIKLVIGSTTVLGSAPGYAWSNCHLWGEDTPGFIITNNCYQNAMVTDMGDLMAHEGGHMYGLPHEYYTWGQPNAHMSGANIMGQFQFRKFINWSAANIAALEPILQLKDDDYQSTWVSNPSNIGQPFAGILVLNDVDAGRFYPSTTQTTVFTLTSDGDAPVTAKLYRNGVLKYTVTTNTALFKSINIPKGNVPYVVIVSISNIRAKHTPYRMNVIQG